MFDVVAFCRDYNVPYRMTGANVGAGWVGINCPFCGDNNYHGGLKGNAYTCWKCGTHSLFDLIKEITGERSKDIYDKYNEEDIFKEKIQRRQAEASSIILPGTTENPTARKYLIKRKFDPDYLERKYKITYTGMTGDYKYRIIIPIFKDGQLVSFQGRDYTGKQEIRYKTLPIEKSVINAKHLLYNEDFVKSDVVGVCEGPFDAMRLGDGFVATLGTKVSEEQVRLLTKYKKVYIVFDPEVEAQERAKNLADRVAVFGSKVYIVDTELDHDPGDMTEGEVKDLRSFIGV